MNLLVNDKKILEKYNEIWDKTKNVFEKKFDSEPVYNDKYIKVKEIQITQRFMVIQHQQQVNIIHGFL